MADTLSVYEDNLLLLTICSSVLFVICLPIYCIGIYKFWKQYYQHFIQKRFPIISMTIILSSFLTATINTAMRWIHYITSNHKSPEISSGCTYLVYGLTNLRLTLIYLRWKQQNQQLFVYSEEFHQELSISSVHSTSDTNVTVNERIVPMTQKKIYYHWFCILLIIFTIICGILIAFVDPETNIYSIIIGIGWFIQIIITITLILIIVFKKVSEGIGCLRETVIMVIYELLIIFMAPLMFISKQMILPMMIIFNLATYIQGLIPLYVPLYYISKIKEVNNVNAKVNINCQLFEFLDTYNNYKCFKKYLSHCWALENLLFYERMSIIYQIVLKLKYNSNINSNTNDVKCDTKVAHIIHHNKFEYLTAIYVEYNKYIIKNINEEKKETEFINVKSDIFKIFQQIYNDFIVQHSLNQINISSGVKKNLIYLLQDDKCIDKFISFDDFLTLFDDSILEIYQLMVTMYNYEFKIFMNSQNN